MRTLRARGFGLRRANRSSVRGGGAGASYRTPPDGYDLILMVGDSTEHGLSAANGASWVRNGTTDTPGVYQYPGPDAVAFGVTPQVITTDITPLYANNDTSNSTDHVAPGEQLGRAYRAGAAPQVANTNRRVLLVNMAKGSQKILASATTRGGTLDIGGVVYEAAITQFNNAIAAAKTAYPGSRVAGICFTSGANDGNQAGVDGALFQTAYKEIIDDLRSRVTGAAESWFVMGGIAPLPYLNTSDYATIRSALISIAAAKSKTYLVNPTGAGSDGLHPSAIQNDQWGNDRFTAIANAAEPTTVEAFTVPAKSGQAASTLVYSAPVVPNVGYGVTVSWSTTGPGVKKNGAAPAASGTYQWGDTLEVGVMTGASGTASATLTVGTQSATFDATVASATTHYLRSVLPGALYFDNGNLRSAVESLTMENA